MMRICSHSPTTLVAHAPAKLNLFLEILGKRSDGFHELESLMCPIDLYDTLAFLDQAEETISLECDLTAVAPSTSANEGEAFPSSADNLVVRALELLRRLSGVRRGMRVKLIKRIPVASGLAGGSSDAAAALWAGNELWRLGLSRAELAELGAELGSDVPFFLVGGAAIARGRGEMLEAVSPLGPLYFVVVRPPQGLSTAEVYRACHAAERPRSVAPLIDALRRGATQQIGRLLHNQLTPAAAGRSKWIHRLRDVFAGQDVCGHQMSGSGTSYFGLCRNARHARRVAARLQGSGVGRVYAVRTSR